MSPARTTKVRMAAQNHRIVHQSPAYPRTKPVIRIHQKPRIITRYDERKTRGGRPPVRGSAPSRAGIPRRKRRRGRSGTRTRRRCGETRSNCTQRGRAPSKPPRRVSEKALNTPAVVDVHAQGRRLLSEARHSHDVACDDDEEARACGGPDLPDFQRPTRRGAEDALVVAQAELGLRDADRKSIEA